MDDITAFLRNRFTEEHQQANTWRLTRPLEGPCDTCKEPMSGFINTLSNDLIRVIHETDEDPFDSTCTLTQAQLNELIDAGPSPANKRLLDEVEAKSRTLNHIHDVLDGTPVAYLWAVTHAMLPIVRLMSLPYATHPDYQEAWRP